ncbi:MAG: DUF4091 domain-containing protein [Desulfobacula sp.]|nr:DUF4091 domain-containing protein [Desulfobacula sp.]
MEPGQKNKYRRSKNIKQVPIRVLLLFFLLFVDKGVSKGICSENNPWPPSGRRMKCPVVKDTWVSSVGDEKKGNNGGSDRLKLKGRQEYFLFDIDIADLKGKIITGALLHTCSITSDKAPFARLGISTLASEWTEGRSKNYRLEKGSSCFEQAQHEEKDWAYPGSTIMDVSFGRGHTVWKFADCPVPDNQGWQACAISPEVVASRIAGISHGFFVNDEVGNVWTLKNGKFNYIKYPNRFCYSRENREKAPWLEIWFDGHDNIPPDTVQDIRIETNNLPEGEALVIWKTPVDKGGGKTLGFHVTYERNKIIKDIPRYMIPMASESDEEVRMHLRDLFFLPGEKITLTIRPVDSSGNIGKPLIKEIALSSTPGSQMIPKKESVNIFNGDNILPEVGGVKICVVDLLDKISPQTGKMIPEQVKSYKSGNHLFSAKEKKIRLFAARNEFVFFQLNHEGTADHIQVKYSFDRDPALQPEIFEFAYVNSKETDDSQTRVLPDPLIPLKTSFSIPSKAGKVFIPNQTNHSLICQLYIPHEELPGKKYGKVQIIKGNSILEFTVDLTVWNFTLPNKLSFVPEMNAYGKSFPLEGDTYYRAAHLHRTCLNRLPYGWNGLPYLAPDIQGDDFEWTRWDQQVGPLLNGSAFKDLPRENEPVDVFYLPFSENWPVNIFENYSPSYWADEAFTSHYSLSLKRYFLSFAQHCDKQKWEDTIFQFYLNNKVYNRANYQKSSAPWVFDEPMNTQDFWALRWYGNLWKSAVAPVQGNTKMWFRGDISYSQFKRDMLKGIMDIEYIGSNNFQKTRMKNEEKILWGNTYFSEYGTANDVSTSNVQPVAWCVSAWAKGAMGVLPWQTIGNDESWLTADQTSLFYPHSTGPKVSIRLKAFTRGQQDVEYLTMLNRLFGIPRYKISNWLNQELNTKNSVLKLDDADAGTAMFDHISPSALWRVRNQAGQMISDKAPAYERALMIHDTPSWSSKNTSRLGYVLPSPEVKPLMPDCDTFVPVK